MDKTFAFSYLKLMKDDGSIIPDGTHELFVYKVQQYRNLVLRNFLFLCVSPDVNQTKHCIHAGLQK